MTRGSNGELFPPFYVRMYFYMTGNYTAKITVIGCLKVCFQANLFVSFQVKISVVYETFDVHT